MDPKPTGEPAKAHIEWVDEVRFRNLNSFDAELIAEFLIGTPALGVSAQSQGFADRYGIKTSDDAEALFNELMKGVENKVAGDAAELAKMLTSSNRLSGEFWTLGEFAFFSIGNPSTVAANNFADAVVNSNSAIADQKKQLVKNKISKLDALFRHLRNSLAHGSFNSFAANGSRIYVFQDANTKGDISARICISESNLRRAITTLRRCEAIGV